jgi:hypothetical protein
MGDTSTKKNHESIVATAKKRFAFALEATSKIREAAAEDKKLRAGDHWTAEEKQKLKANGSSCITINKIPQHVKQVTNDQRQNRPRIKVSPFDDVADPETAQTLQGLIRSIENYSNADTAYDTAFENAVDSSFGYLRITTEYVSPMSFDQEARIATIQDTNTVMLDPSHIEPDGSDAEWGFIFEDITKEDFKARYPDAEMSSETFSFDGLDTNWQNSSDETVRVSEYFVKEYKKDTLIELDDGSTVLQSDIDKTDREDQEEIRKLLENSDKKLRKRTVSIPIVKWYKINGSEVLDETEFPSRFIPIIPVYGSILIVDGEKRIESLIRHSKDSQRMYNYWATSETNAISLTQKAPYIGYEGQFDGHEEKWRNAHVKNYPYLEVKPVTHNGQPAPLPQRSITQPNVSAITNARMIASDDIKSTTGIYDASLGNRSNESSGKAITRRNQQSQTSNFHFIDNLRRSMRHCGRILLDVIPRIYDTKRVVRILGEDDVEKMVAINSIFKDKDGKEKIINDFSKGRYDCVIDSGPSYASKRQEAVDSMLDLTRHYPKAAEVAGDLMVKSMDWPMADEVAKRLKLTLPPGLTDEDESKDIPPEIQAQLQQQGQLLESLTEELNKSKDLLESKEMDLKSKERIEFAKIEAQLKIKEAELQAKGATPEMLQHLVQEAIEANMRQLLVEKDIPINQDEIAEQLENELLSDQQEIPPVAELTGELTPGLDNGEMLTE